MTLLPSAQGENLSPRHRVLLSSRVYKGKDCLVGWDTLGFLGKMVLLVNAFIGLLSPWLFTETVTLEDRPLWLLLGTLCSLQSPPSGSMSFPRAAKMFQGLGKKNTGFIMPKKKTLFEIKIKQLQNLTVCWQVNCNSTCVVFSHVKSICVRCGHVVYNVGPDPKSQEAVY